MIFRFADDLKVGDFVRVADQFAHERFRRMWWRVTGIDGVLVHLTNRHGHRDIWLAIHGVSRGFNVWEPGDPQEDDVVL